MIGSTANMIVIAVTYKAKPGKREEAVGAARICAEKTRREAGNREYTFYAGIDGPEAFFLFEQWESQKALDVHLKSVHLASFRKALGDLTAEPPLIRIFEASELKSDQTTFTIASVSFFVSQTSAELASRNADG